MALQHITRLVQNIHTDYQWKIGLKALLIALLMQQLFFFFFSSIKEPNGSHCNQEQNGWFLHEDSYEYSCKK